MKAKVSLYLTIAALFAALVATGCSRARSDGQIATDVHSKITSDSGVQNKSIKIDSAGGVVTLSGTVASDAERMAAANDAAQVPGVKTVVNNLEVNSAANQQQPTQEAAAQTAQEAGQTDEEAPAPARRSRATAPRAYRHTRPTASAKPAPHSNVSGAPGGALSGGDTAADTVSSVVSAPVETPRQPIRVTVPDGTMLTVRLTDTLDSATSNPGDVFHGTLDAPVTVDEKTALPAGADVQGRVV